MGLCGTSCSSLPPIRDIPALIYCILISEQFVRYSTVRCMRTFGFPSSSSSSCQHQFINVYYVTVEQRKFHDIRIEFLTTEGPDMTLEERTTPTNAALHFRKYYKNCIKRGFAISNRAFKTKHPLEVYYLNRMSRGITLPCGGIGPFYSAPLYVQRGQGTLRTGGKILTVIASQN